MTEHYFATPQGPEKRRTIRCEVWGEDVELITANGVFAGGGLDRATAILFQESAPPTAARRLLDLGCGYGPIAIALATHCPEAEVDAVDVNDRALALTRDNSAAHGVADRIRAGRPEDFDAAARYDEIWSNPPIRIGKEALHTLLLTWLPRLAPQGRARLVVGKNLGADSLQRWLVDQGYDCERVASAKGFRILVITPGR